jgi:hypothetical protein
MADKIKIGNRAKLVNNLVVIGGITRSGKFLLGSLISSLEKIEPFQDMPCIEAILPMFRYGIMSDESAIALMQLRIDISTYNTLVGRKLNFRYDDISSVFKSGEFDLFIQRCFNKDRSHVVDTLHSGKRIPLLIIHELLSNINIFFKAFPFVKIIDIKRHPVDLIHSWYKRGWGSRFGVDPTSLVLTFQGKQDSIPWYGYKSVDDYEDSSEIGRVIRCIKNIIDMEQEEYNSLSSDLKKQILIITFEKLVTESTSELSNIAAFIGTEISEHTPLTLFRERCPRKLDKIEREKKFDEIKSLSNSEEIKIVEKLSDIYETTKGKYYV